MRLFASNRVVKDSDSDVEWWVVQSPSLLAANLWQRWKLSADHNCSHGIQQVLWVVELGLQGEGDKMDRNLMDLWYQTMKKNTCLD